MAVLGGWSLQLMRQTRKERMKIKVKNAPRYERLLKARKEKEKDLTDNEAFAKALKKVNKYLAKNGLK